MLVNDEDLPVHNTRTSTSYFFRIPAEGVAAGSQRLESGRRPVRDDALVDGHGRGVHLLGLDALHISSADGATFFVLVLAQERSAQFRASISREFFFQRFQWGVRTAPLHGTHTSPLCPRHSH